MRANDGSAMRKWMGFLFTKGNLRGPKNCPTREFADFFVFDSACNCGFFPDYHAIRIFFFFAV